MESAADIAQPNLFGNGIVGHAVRTAQPDAIEFFQHAASGVQKWVVVGNIIMGSAAGRLRAFCLGLAANWMASGRIAIYIDADDA